MTLYHFKSDLLIWALFDAYDYMVIVEANDDISFYDLVPYTCSDLFDYLYEEGSPFPIIDE